MKRKTFVLLPFIILAISVGVFLFCFAAAKLDDAVYAGDSSNYYRIQNLDITIDVAKNGNAKITEVYDVDFIVASRGITRYLAVGNGERYRDIKVEGDSYFLDYGTKFLEVCTGAKSNSSSGYFTGTRRYVISYTLIPPDKAVKDDRYYINVIGDWDTSISDIDVRMTFPYDVYSDTEVYYGKYGSGNTLDFSVSDNTITIHRDRLAPHEGITVDAVIARNFKANISGLAVALIILVIILLALLVAAKFVLFKDKELTPVVEFYPPEKDGRKITPAEAGTIIDGVVDDMDVTSVIFYLASKGYIKIDDSELSVKLIRCADVHLENEPQHIHIIYNGLFDKRDEVTVDSLKNKFYVTVNKAKSSIAKETKSAGFYNFKPCSVFGAITLILLAAALIFVCGLPSTKLISDIWGMLLPVGMGVLTFFAGAISIFELKKIKLTLSKGKYMLLIAVTALDVAILSAAFSLMFFNGATYFWVKLLIFMFGGVAGMIAASYMRRTDEYIQSLNLLLGFKDFIESAEKDRIETLVNDNPEYYYDILPYANVLGISDACLDKFAALTTQPPAYYSNPRITVFDIMIFNSFYRTSFVSLRSAMTIRPSNPPSSHFGGGGFGGGGFSGGGFGGGGGGRR